METIHLKYRTVKVIRKNIKHMYLKIKRNSGEVQVVAPRFLSDEEVRAFVEDKEAWIITHTRTSQNIRLIEDPLIRHGEKIYIFGKTIRLKINYIEKNPLYVEEEGENLVLNIKENTSHKKAEILLREWYRNKLKIEMNKYIGKWEAIMGVKVNKAGTKKMKTRWGTCNPSRKNIWINLELAKLPKKYLEYVVVHEMVHFFESGHGEAFKRKMDRFYPKWRDIREEMKLYAIV